MKWTLVKILCIAGTGVLGALLSDDLIVGIIVAPFGWFIFKFLWQYLLS